MNKHPRIGNTSLLIGLLSFVVQTAQFLRFPLFHWAMISNMVVGVSLIIAGLMLRQGHRMAYILGIFAWAFVALISGIDLAIQFWSHARGASIPWVVFVLDAAYLVGGVYIVAFLVVSRRNAGGSYAA